MKAVMVLADQSLADKYDPDDLTNPWYYLVVLAFIALAVYQVTKRETPPRHANWVRLAKELDGRPEVTARTRADMSLHEVRRIAAMLGYDHVSHQSAPRGFERHRLVRRPGLPDVPRKPPKGWWK